MGTVEIYGELVLGYIVDPFSYWLHISYRNLINGNLGRKENIEF